MLIQITRLEGCACSNALICFLKPTHASKNPLSLTKLSFMNQDYLESVTKQFEYYKLLAEKSFAQVSDEHLFFQYNSDSNSIAIIVKHLGGNMLSRWTDFLNTDGEKEWRNRDAEFESSFNTRDEMMQVWNQGWTGLQEALADLKEEDLSKIIYIRNQGQTVVEAINRQLCHYPYHIGQIVFLAKMLSENSWQSLSIPKGNSNAYNSEKFSKAKTREHFTDEVLKKKES